MDTDDKHSFRERWALLRFAVVGPILAAPPAVGELRPALIALSEKVWRHPISGVNMRFGASTIERWYYSARAANNPVAALRNRPRSNLGRFPSISPRTVELLTIQYCAHPSWTVQQHFDSIDLAMTGIHAPMVSYPTVRRYLRANGMVRMPQEHNSKSTDPERRWHKWVDSLMRDVIPEVTGRPLLIKNLFGTHFQRQKTLVILANEQGFSNAQITKFLGVSSSSVCRYLKSFRAGGAENLFQRKSCTPRENDEVLNKTVFSLLHEPPSLSGVNRTTWKMADIKTVLKERGFHASLSVIRKIIKKAGFRWKMARVVLTSNDPDYRKKLDHVHEILANLKPDERFFSIDEYGPQGLRTRHA